MQVRAESSLLELCRAQPNFFREKVAYWGTLCNNLSTLACYFLADNADHAEECSMAVLFRRERQFGVSVVLGFVSVNLRDLREIHGVSLMID